MQNIFQLFIFLASVFFIMYSYVLFPIILNWIGGKRVFSFGERNAASGVSILISVFNEETVIKEKIETVLNSNYPPHLIEILIGSDCSTDNTNRIISDMKLNDNRIRLFEFANRRGKPSVINDLMREAKFPLVILTDANVYFDKENIALLERHFIHPNVGLVGANILNVGLRKDGISIQEKSYIQRENKIKYQEGVLWGTMMGPFGGCYMIRKDLYEEVPSNALVDDFFICMSILEKGSKSLNDLSAICYEDVSNEVKEEFRRKIRISTGNFQNLSRFKKFIFNPFSAIGFCFLSHKFLRWITPLFILASVFALNFLAKGNLVFRFLFFGELVLLLMPMIDFVLKRIGIHLKIVRFISYFSLMNAALVIGFLKFLFGKKSGIWNPTKRN